MTDLSFWMDCVRVLSSSRVRRRVDCEEEAVGADAMPLRFLLI